MISSPSVPVVIVLIGPIEIPPIECMIFGLAVNIPSMLVADVICIGFLMVMLPIGLMFRLPTDVIVETVIVPLSATLPWNMLFTSTTKLPCGLMFRSPAVVPIVDTSPVPDDGL